MTKQADEERTGFDDWLPVRAEYIAPGEYKIVTCGGLPLWYMEGAALAEWICERINAGVYDDATDAAFEQYLKTDPDVQRALKQAADARTPTIPDPGAVSGQGWQPMDSAPKDGSIVLAWRSGWERPAFVRWVYNNRTKTTFWNDSLEWDAYEMESQPPTHWIPLSEPPKENER